MKVDDLFLRWLESDASDSFDIKGITSAQFSYLKIRDLTARDAKPKAQ